MRRAASDSRGLKGTLFLADLCMLILAWFPLLVAVGPDAPPERTLVAAETRAGTGTG
jgi:hypothetical protein